RSGWRLRFPSQLFLFARRQPRTGLARVDDRCRRRLRCVRYTWRARRSRWNQSRERLLQRTCVRIPILRHLGERFGADRFEVVRDGRAARSRGWADFTRRRLKELLRLFPVERHLSCHELDEAEAKRVDVGPGPSASVALREELLRCPILWRERGEA